MDCFDVEHWSRNVGSEMKPFGFDYHLYVRVCVCVFTFDHQVLLYTLTHTHCVDVNHNHYNYHHHHHHHQRHYHHHHHNNYFSWFFLFQNRKRKDWIHYGYISWIQLPMFDRVLVHVAVCLYVSHTKLFLLLFYYFVFRNFFIFYFCLMVNFDNFW